VLADGGAPAVLADAPHSVVLADGGAPAVLALALLSVVPADGGAPICVTAVLYWCALIETTIISPSIYTTQSYHYLIRA